MNFQYLKDNSLCPKCRTPFNNTIFEISYLFKFCNCRASYETNTAITFGFSSEFTIQVLDKSESNDNFLVFLYAGDKFLMLPKIPSWILDPNALERIEELINFS